MESKKKLKLEAKKKAALQTANDANFQQQVNLNSYIEQFNAVKFKGTSASFDLETPQKGSWASLERSTEPMFKPVYPQGNIGIAVGVGDYVKETTEDSVPKVTIAPICYSCKQSSCEICKVCETAECILVGKMITSKYQMIQVGLADAKTQKAKGFLRLKSHFGLTIPYPYSIITEDDDIKYVIEGDDFIRPCPVRPRHGFVESRAMRSTPENVRLVWDEARAADPEAELIVCRQINAKWNAIITPSMLAVGPGHDGATGGRESVSFPLMGVLPPEIADESKLMVSGVDIKVDDPYLELVKRVGDGVWIYTQLRAGAKVPKAPDYVPERIRVDRILEASGDLMEWEQQVKWIEKGTVVYHIGGTLISHYGVHCVTNKIPLMTTRVPVRGEVLEECGLNIQYEPATVAKGLALGSMIPLLDNGTYRNIRDFLPLMMTTLHNAPAMGNGYGVWLGFAVGIMMRAGMAASHGEARHADVKIKGYSRESIYETALRDFFGARRTLGRAQFAFVNHKWNGSFGGKPWADCTRSIFNLDKAARDILREPTEAHRIALVNALNAAVNQAHNGGWWLNKFINQDYFTAASSQSLIALHRVLNVLIPCNDYFKSISEAEWKAVAWKWMNEPDIVVESKGTGIVSIDEDGNIEDDQEDDDTTDYGDEEGPCSDPFCLDCHPPEEKESEPEVDTNDTGLEVAGPSPTTAPIPTPDKPKSKGVYKVGFNANYHISKAHIRLEWTGSVFGAHIQCLLEGDNQYWSFDHLINPEVSQKLYEIFNKPNADFPFEGSYSSHAGGYLDMEVTPVNSAGAHGWWFTEPVTKLSLLLSNTGAIGGEHIPSTPLLPGEVITNGEKEEILEESIF